MVGIFRTSLVEIGVICAHPPLTFWFFNHDHICQPCGVLGFFYEGDFDKFVGFLACYIALLFNHFLFFWAIGHASLYTERRCVITFRLTLAYQRPSRQINASVWLTNLLSTCCSDVPLCVVCSSSRRGNGRRFSPGSIRASFNRGSRSTKATICSFQGDLDTRDWSLVGPRDLGDCPLLYSQDRL